MLFVKFVLLSVISNNLFMHQIHSFIMSDKLCTRYIHSLCLIRSYRISWHLKVNVVCFSRFFWIASESLHDWRNDELAFHDDAMTWKHFPHYWPFVIWSFDVFFVIKLNTLLTHWGWDKMAAIFQTTFSNGFSWIKIYEFRLKFHWSLFLGIQLTIFQHWFG